MEDKHKMIMIIDDNHSLRKAISNSLDFAGYKVLETDNGIDGLRLVEQNKPDLILCDI